MTIYSIPEGWLRLSYSGISSYEECPLKYKFSYVDRVKIVESPQRALCLGNTIHGAISSFFKGSIRTKESLIEKYLKTSFRSFYYENDNLIFSEKDSNQDYKEASRQLSSIWSSFDRSGYFDSHFRVEHEFFSEVKDHNVVLHGFIDCLFNHDDGVVEVIDYKTGGKRYTQSEVQSNLQLTIYGHYIRSKGILVDIYTIYSTKYDSMFRTTRDEKDFIELRDYIGKISDKIRDENFPANPGLACKYCKFTSVCPAFKEYNRDSF